MEEDANGTPPGRNRRQSDTLYLAVAGGLLLVICGALAILWVVERRHRVSAEVERDQLRVKLSRYEHFQKMGGASLLALAAGAGPAQAGPEPLRREGLVVQRVEHAGRTRDLLLVPAGVGRRLGFEVDDLILISRPPTSAPSRAPATAPASRAAEGRTDPSDRRRAGRLAPR